MAPRIDVGLATISVHGQTLDGFTVTLDDPEGFAGVVLVQVVDVSRQGDAEEVVLLPEAAQLLVQNIGAHGKRADHRVYIDIPNLRGFVSRGR